MSPLRNIFEIEIFFILSVLRELLPSNLVDYLSPHDRLLRLRIAMHDMPSSGRTIPALLLQKSIEAHSYLSPKVKLTLSLIPMNTFETFSRRRSSIPDIFDGERLLEDMEMLITKRSNNTIENDNDNLVKKAKERQMSKGQEVFNAITMIPCPLVALYFILAGKWLSDSDILQTKENLQEFITPSPSVENHFFDDDQCIYSSYLPHLYALPPLPTLAIAIGVVLHAPCSIFYHLMCAYKLPTGIGRLNHWSRRLDQSMIHIMSLVNSYGNSGNIDFTVFVLVLVMDSIYHLQQPGHRPLKRMIVAFLMPILPLIANGYLMEAMKLLFIYGVSGWLFAAYPFGGWSHGMFHLVVVFSIPVTLSASTNLEASREALQIASRCAALFNAR